MAALLPLVRPDGWIFALATVVIERKRPRRLLPLLVPIAHVVWRKVHYGSWLPRTWFTQAAPGLMESGSMYLMSFVLEYAYWGWLALVLLCALKVPRGTRKELLTHEATPVVIALLVHFAYYTFRLGRRPARVPHLRAPRSAPRHLVLRARAPRRIRGAGASPSIRGHARAGACGPMDSLRGREADRPLLPTLWNGVGCHPAVARGPRVRATPSSDEADRRRRRASFSPRAVGQNVDSAGHPVVAVAPIGYPGWSLPHVAIVDPRLGNTMCLLPNVTHSGDAASAQPRGLSDDEISRCESFAPKPF